MLTLNQATSMTKNFTKWLGVFFGVIFLSFVLFRLGILIKNIVAPTPPPPPTVSFGIIPAVEFPINIDGTNYSFVVDTVTGKLPVFPDRAKVYKVTEESADLLALEKTGNNVASGGFTSGPIKVTENIYQWTDPNSDIGKKIRIDIFTSKFNISSAYFSNPQVLSSTNFPPARIAKERGQSYLEAMSLFPDDIDADATKVNFFIIQGSQLSQTNSPANAQVIKLDFFQKSVDKLPIVYPNPNSSPMGILVGGGQNLPQVLQADFFHQEISKDSSTYPIKTPEKAFSELKEGNAYVASPGSSEDILIQDISLAYYLSDEKQEYMEPIIVFKGNNGFLAYLQAVTDEWISK